MLVKPIVAAAKLEQMALGAARAAGWIHLRRLSRIKVIRKTNAIDLVTEADRESEQTVIRTLNRAFLDHAILAEESGANARRSEHRWIVDPLDGTRLHRAMRETIAKAWPEADRRQAEGRAAP